MKNLSKYIDPLQITGFALSLAVAIGLVLAKQDTLFSLLIGLTLAALTQLFDIQARMTASSEKLENLSVEGIEKAIRSLGGVSVIRFKDSQHLYEHAAKRTREARKTIDDMTMGFTEREHTPAAQKAFERYLETIHAVCSKSTIAYRELMSFPSFSHFERAEVMLSKNYFGYRLKYYEYIHEKEIPSVIQFMVVDSEEVIIAFYRSRWLPVEREIRLAIRHPDIVELFQDYYDTLWQGAKTLSNNRNDELAALQELKKQFVQKASAP